MAVYHIIDPRLPAPLVFHSKTAADIWVQNDLDRQKRAAPLGYWTRLKIIPGHPPAKPVEDPLKPPTPWHDVEDMRTWAVLGDGTFIWVANPTLIRAGIVTQAELDEWLAK